MPPRYAYWTIIADGLPTAFRAADRDELLPTFARIKQKHPDAQMKWFARGKLWESPESARRQRDTPPSDLRRDRQDGRAPGHGREHRSGRPGPRKPAPHGGPHEARGRDWRPGGDHRDPRQKFKDAKKARNIEQRRRKFDRRQRFDRKADGQGPRGENRPRTEEKRWNAAKAHPRPDRRERRGDDQKTFGRPQRPQGPRAQLKTDEHAPRGDSRQRLPNKEWNAAKAGPRPDWRERRRFETKTFGRNQGTDEPQTPQRPQKPEREPRRREGTEPTPPPRPSEPVTTPPGPPERGRHRGNNHRRR